MSSWYDKKDDTELEANKGSPNGHCRDLVSGDPEVKLKSVSIWRGSLLSTLPLFH